MALQTRVVLSLFSLFVECPLPDTIYYRTFPQVCYRTLAEYKGSGFLGFSMVCASICKNIDSLEKNAAVYDYSFEKV